MDLLFNSTIASNSCRRYLWKSTYIAPIDFSKSDKVIFSIYVYLDKINLIGYLEFNKPVGLGEVKRLLKDMNAKIFNTNGKAKDEIISQFSNFVKNKNLLMNEYGINENISRGRKPIAKPIYDIELKQELENVYKINDKYIEDKQIIKVVKTQRTTKTILYWYRGDMDKASTQVFEESGYNKDNTNISILTIRSTKRKTYITNYRGENKVILFLTKPLTDIFDELCQLGGKMPYEITCNELLPDVQFIASECWIVTEYNPREFIPKNTLESRLLSIIDKEIIFSDNPPIEIPKWTPKSQSRCIYAHHRNGKQEVCTLLRTEGSLGCPLCTDDIKYHKKRYNYRCSNSNCEYVILYYDYEQDNIRHCDYCRKINPFDPSKQPCEESGCYNYIEPFDEDVDDDTERIRYCRSCWNERLAFDQGSDDE